MFRNTEQIPVGLNKTYEQVGISFRLIGSDEFQLRYDSVSGPARNRVLDTTGNLTEADEIQAFETSGLDKNFPTIFVVKDYDGPNMSKYHNNGFTARRGYPLSRWAFLREPQPDATWTNLFDKYVRTIGHEVGHILSISTRHCGAMGPNGIYRSAEGHDFAQPPKRYNLLPLMSYSHPTGKWIRAEDWVIVQLDALAIMNDL